MFVKFTCCSWLVRNEDGVYSAIVLEMLSYELHINRLLSTISPAIRAQSKRQSGAKVGVQSLDGVCRVGKT